MAGTPRDASTVILARRTPDGGYEVLLTRRPDTMRFMGGNYVFPGGALDESDCSAEIESLSVISPPRAREMIGEDIPPERALGLFCCAARELFEEVGVLLAQDREGKRVDPAAVRERYAGRHREAAQDADAFAVFLRSEGLVLATDALVWHGRLVTPEAAPIRFDARFFVAAMPDGQTLVLDPDEVPEAMWIAPTDAIKGAEAERLPIPIPTMSILQGLSEIPSFDELLGGARVTREILSAPLSPLVSYVLAPNPGMMTLAGTNTYVVGRGETVIIDPAVPDPIYIEAVVREAANRGAPRLVLLTHMHSDHTGGAEAIVREFGCPVAAWKGALENYAFVTQAVDDEEKISIGGATLRALHTPGHASHHLCYLLEEERSLFAGDVVAGLGTVVIAPPDGSLADYMQTLARLASLDVTRIFPAHGPTIEDGPGKLAEYISHRKDRERQVIEAMTAGETEIPKMVKRIYTDVDEKLHKVAEMSVLAHLEVLERAGRARRDGDKWTLAGS
jgi:glyoxylase-like metal-dependent hydrolase (beta-lactamase superfamily II)/8-oxo-dGTP pyrophosphatase MutT (NUDIX family)